MGSRNFVKAGSVLRSFVICDFDGTITLKDSTDLL
jgi:hypothetical protein